MDSLYRAPARRIGSLAPCGAAPLKHEIPLPTTSESFCRAERSKGCIRPARRAAEQVTSRENSVNFIEVL